MPDSDALDERLRAVERALTESDDDLTDLQDAAKLTRELETLAARFDEMEDRLDELDAATQALRGYVGNVRAVNQSVERRADAALAKVEALEADRRGRGGDESGGNRPEEAGSGDRATESDRSPPCGCRARRCGTGTVADERDATAGPDRRSWSEQSRNRSEQSRNRSEQPQQRSGQSRDRGLLARIVEAL